MASNAVSAVLGRDCALRVLEVGEIPMAEESVPAVAAILAPIFPRIKRVKCVDGNWEKVMDAIRLRRQIVDYSSKEHPSAHRSIFFNISLGTLDGCT